MMLINHVQVHVKEEFIEAFREASAENAKQSILEAGIAGFHVMQQIDDPSRFIFIEVFRNENGQAHHRETAHYSKWRDAVAPMMAEPRLGVKFSPVAGFDAV
jgi:quinol monooxygenase YgiN